MLFFVDASVAEHTPLVISESQNVPHRPVPHSQRYASSCSFARSWLRERTA